MLKSKSSVLFPLIAAAFIAAFFWSHESRKAAIRENNSLEAENVELRNELALSDESFMALEAQRKADILALTEQYEKSRQLATSYEAALKNIPSTDCAKQRVNPSIAEWMRKSKGGDSSQDGEAIALEKPP